MRTTIDAAGRLVVSEGSGTSAGFAVGTVESASASASAGTVLPGVVASERLLDVQPAGTGCRQQPVPAG